MKRSSSPCLVMSMNRRLSWIFLKSSPIIGTDRDDTNKTNQYRGIPCENLRPDTSNPPHTCHEDGVCPYVPPAYSLVFLWSPPQWDEAMCVCTGVYGLYLAWRVRSIHIWADISKTVSASPDHIQTIGLSCPLGVLSLGSVCVAVSTLWGLSIVYDGSHGFWSIKCVSGL